jgi:hypothetical protein
MATSILIRTLIADVASQSQCRRRHGPAERSGREWEETVAKARGPLDAIGSREVVAEVAGEGVSGAHTSGSTAAPAADGAHLSAFDRGPAQRAVQTLRVRADRPTELAEHTGQLRDPRPASDRARRP